MNNLWVIYRYELKKIIDKKLFWITAIFCMAGILISAYAGMMGANYVNGEPVESYSDAFFKDKAYQKELSGRYIDEGLLQETVDGYAHVPTDVPAYTLTDEYEAFARPYSEIFYLIRQWTGMNLSEIQNWDVDITALYEKRAEYLESNWQSIPLTETEKNYWRAKEKLIDKPLLYSFHKGYEHTLSSLLTVGVIMLLFVAICLSGLFPEEHVRRTDQLILSSIRGKRLAYWAKTLAGVTTSVAAATLMALMTIGACLGIYGAEGFEMPFQTCYTSYSYPITIGQACLIGYGVLIVTSVLAAVFVMVVSELFRSGIVALSVSTGLIILGNVIMIPTQYRVLAQIWDWSPMTYLSIWNIFDARTLPLLGKCFTSWQAVPVIYILLSVILAVGGKYIYRQYQVSGR